MTLWLLDRFEEYGERTAVVFDGVACSYGELRERTAAWSKRLDDGGVDPRAAVALVGDFSPETCSAFLALIERGNVAVPLMPTTFDKHPEFLDIAEIGYVIHSDEGDDITRRDVTPSHPLMAELKERGQSGLVLFSSGSTGDSKAALHAIPALLDKYRERRPSLITLTFLLLDHIGGVNTFFHVLANGGTVVATRDRTPKGVCKAIEDGGVELLPVSPTFLNLCLLSGEWRKHDLSSLKKITYGTEPMPASTLERLVEAFPGVVLQQTYGLSELGITRSKSPSNDTLWVRIGGAGFETRVVDGILHIRSASAMLGYLNAPSPFDDEGWFNTQDMVEVDGDLFRFLGRKSEVINVGGVKVFPSEVESHLLDLPNIRDATVVGEKNALSGMMVVARVNLVEPEDQAAVKRRIRKELKQRLEPYKVPQKVLVMEDSQFNDRFKRMRSVRA